MTGIVPTLTVKLKMPKYMADGVLQYAEGEYTMTFAEGGVAGEENLNAAYDIRLVEEME